MNSNRPINTLFGIAVVVGMLFAVFIPFGAGFDEEQHLVRVLEIGKYNWLPNRESGGKAFALIEFFMYSNQRQYFQAPADFLFDPDIFWRPVNRFEGAEVQTRSIYSPVIFLPQAMIARYAWLRESYPVIPVTIMMRLVGLGLYLAGLGLALRWLPNARLIFVLLALSPMALYQAATVNADGFTSAAAFLFFAAVMNGLSTRPMPLSKWQLVMLSGSALMVGFAKPATFLVFPLLLLLPLSRYEKKWQAAAVWLAVVAAVIASLWWMAVAAEGSHFDAGGGQSVTRQLDLILANPVDFVVTFVLGNLAALGRYFKDWAGVYGHWAGVVPGGMYWLYALALVAALVAERKSYWLGRRERLWLGGVGLAACAGIALLFYYSNYQPGDWSVFGRQGRYLIPFTPVLFAALAGLADGLVKRPALWRWLVLGGWAGAILLYGIGLYATYYTFCGSSYYTLQSCVQPVYKNLDIQAHPALALGQGEMLEQTILPVCGPLEWLEMVLISTPAEGDGELHLRVLDDAGNLLVEQTLALRDVQSGGWVRVTLGEAIRTQGHVRLQIKAQGLSVGEAIGFANDGEGMVREGTLRLNGVEISPDLIFRYACAAPWR